jgi:hypothetical protein
MTRMDLNSRTALRDLVHSVLAYQPPTRELEFENLVLAL